MNRPTGEDFEPFRLWCNKHSRIQGDMLGRVLRWFVKQKPVVWRAIVDDLDDDELRPALAALLRSLAEQVSAEDDDGNPGEGVVIDAGPNS